MVPQVLRMVPVAMLVVSMAVMVKVGEVLAVQVVLAVHVAAQAVFIVQGMVLEEEVQAVLMRERRRMVYPAVHYMAVVAAELVEAEVEAAGVEAEVEVLNPIAAAAEVLAMHTLLCQLLPL